MEKFLPALENCPLFAGIGRRDLQALLTCLAAVQRRFEKNGFIFSVGDRVESVGVVLSGSVHVLREDFWGNRSILTRVELGGLFGEAFACAGAENLPVGVMAAEESEILLMNHERMLTSCPSACAFHTALIRNLTRILAEKNVILTQKLEHVTRRTTREKLLSYLSERAKLAKGNVFDIPFSRQELADYLSVERSAMSAELSRMRNEGLLRYKRNHFELCGSEYREVDVNEDARND